MGGMSRNCASFLEDSSKGQNGLSLSSHVARRRNVSEANYIREMKRGLNLAGTGSEELHVHFLKFST